MKNIKDIAVVIQARLSSARIPQKMIKPFAGTTLLDISLNKIKECKSFEPESFWLSVNEPELVSIGKSHGVNIFHRSEASANSEGTPLTEMYEWWDKLSPHKYCVLINACAPMLTSETIDNFIEAYMKTDSDGLFGVIEKKNYFWDTNNKLITKWTAGEACMNTKTVDATYEAAHCLYAGRLDKIKDGIWMGDFLKPGDLELFSMKEEEVLDIDYPWEFTAYESVYGANK